MPDDPLDCFLDSFSMEVWLSRGANHVTGGLKVSAPTPQLPGRREQLGIKLIINGQLFNPSCLHNGTSIKTLNNGFPGASGLVNASMC